MTQDDQGAIVLKPTPETKKTIDELCKLLGVTTGELFRKSIVLLEMVQGRKVVLKDDNESWEINAFTKNPKRIKLNAGSLS